MPDNGGTTDTELKSLCLTARRGGCYGESAPCVEGRTDMSTLINEVHLGSSQEELSYIDVPRPIKHPYVWRWLIGIAAYLALLALGLIVAVRGHGGWWLAWPIVMAMPVVIAIVLFLLLTVFAFVFREAFAIEDEDYD